MRTAPLLGLQKRAKDALPHRRQARDQTARLAPLHDHPKKLTVDAAGGVTSAAALS